MTARPALHAAIAGLAWTAPALKPPPDRPAPTACATHRPAARRAPGSHRRSRAPSPAPRARPAPPGRWSDRNRSTKVTSNCQRETNHWRISTGAASRSVQRKACGGSSPRGSRTSSQRMGTGGDPPRYQTAVPVAIWMTRLVRPYQRATVWRCQTVPASCSTCVSVGRRLPPAFAGAGS